MLGYTYAMVAIYTAVLMEYVLELRHEVFARNVLLGLSVALFIIIITLLNNDRKYYKRFKLHATTVWGKDFSQKGGEYNAI